MFAYARAIQDDTPVPGPSGLDNVEDDKLSEDANPTYNNSVDRIIRQLAAIVVPERRALVEAGLRVLLTPETFSTCIQTASASIEGFSQFLHESFPVLMVPKSSLHGPHSDSVPISSHPPTTSRVTRRSLKLAEAAAAESSRVEDDISRAAGLQDNLPTLSTRRYSVRPRRESRVASLSLPHNATRNKKRSRDQAISSSSDEDWFEECDEVSADHDILNDPSLPPTKKPKRSTAVPHNLSEQPSDGTSLSHTPTRIQVSPTTKSVTLSPKTDIRRSVESLTLDFPNDNSGLEYGGDDDNRLRSDPETDEDISGSDSIPHSSNGEQAAQEDQEDQDVPSPQTSVADEKDTRLSVPRDATPVAQKPVSDSPALDSRSACTNTEEPTDSKSRKIPTSLRRALYRRQKK